MSKPALLEICGLWRGAPIILASKSGGRARLLESAGIPFEAVDSEVDERRLEGIDVLSRMRRRRASPWRRPKLFHSGVPTGLS